MTIFFATPTPPSMTTDPVSVLVDCVVLLALSCPDILTTLRSLVPTTVNFLLEFDNLTFSLKVTGPSN